TLNLLGLCACAQGDLPSARQRLEEGWELCRDIGDKRSLAYALEAFASLSTREQHPERAALLLGAASALRESIGSPLPPSEQPADTARKRGLRDALGEDVFTGQWNAGRTLSIAEAVPLTAPGSSFTAPGEPSGPYAAP